MPARAFVCLAVLFGFGGATLPASDPIPTSYHAVKNRTPYPEPAVPAMGSAGARILDPTFGSQILRVTDANTRPAEAGRSYASPSAAHQLAWNATSTLFYVRSIDGWFIPFTFNPLTMTASRIAPTPGGDGGLKLFSVAEPQFSFLQPNILYVSGQDPQNDWPTVRAYNFSTATYSDLLNLGIHTPLKGATYSGALSSSATVPEKVSLIAGGAQDSHYKAVVFAVNNPAATLAVVDTQAATVTVNGKTVPTGLSPFFLHHSWIDQTGNYVVLYPVSQSPVAFVIWNLTTHTFTLNSTHAFGHDALGFGWQVNQDCCTSGAAYDGAQWQLRALSAPAATSDLIIPMLTPQQIYIADHTSWNNAQPDRRVPILSSTYRYYDGTFNTAPWRAWDNEIIAIQTDAGSAGATVWRFAHHRSNVARDDAIDGTYFWYQPHANVSPNGRWALFTSNWEKTLGNAHPAETDGGAALFRTDVFIVSLAAGSFTDDPLTVSGTIVRAIHFIELRVRVNVLRAQYKLPPVLWTDPLLLPGTVVRAAHLTQLRTALQDAYKAASQPPPSFGEPITAGVTVIRASHLQELRDAVLALEGS